MEDAQWTCFMHVVSFFVFGRSGSVQRLPIIIRQLAVRAGDGHLAPTHCCLPTRRRGGRLMQTMRAVSGPDRVQTKNMFSKAC